ncbi:hypothetical protein FB45DRAFT_869659 [Roridomyces roridus]|uniref:Uncharacterized protein n=1 Tax=Roridomyces roridus TaxID=1738132 RepID=A0AAD7BLZ7_9AGAR|nr:hypothetical protein FB45DRAFT_869659 [Roridomyces roridus]
MLSSHPFLAATTDSQTPVKTFQISLSTDPHICISIPAGPQAEDTAQTSTERSRVWERLKELPRPQLFPLVQRFAHHPIARTRVDEDVSHFGPSLGIFGLSSSLRRGRRSICATLESCASLSACRKVKAPQVDSDGRQYTNGQDVSQGYIVKGDGSAGTDEQETPNSNSDRPACLSTLVHGQAGFEPKKKRIGNAQLQQNWHLGSTASPSSILRQIFCGFCLGMLGLTGLECTP